MLEGLCTRWKQVTGYSGWPADLEFLETWKSQGILCHYKKNREKIREIREIWKSQGILLARNEYAEVFSKLVPVVNKN